VGGAVIVSKGIDAIAPRRSPIVLGIQILQGIRQLPSACGDYRFVDQQRQTRIVRYIARVCKEMHFGLAHRGLPMAASSPCTPPDIDAKVMELRFSLLPRRICSFVLTGWSG
jgi:hypothetical protein